MSSRKNLLVTAGFVAAASLIAAAVTALLVSYQCGRLSFGLLNAVYSEVAEREPGALPVLSAALKEYTEGNPDGKPDGNPGENLDSAPYADALSGLGYRASDFSGPALEGIALPAGIGFFAGTALFLCTFLYRNRAESRRIRALTEYLEQVNTGKALILSASGEDDFSRLADEIYKTVTSLYQMRDSAVQARNAFAENLSNIAHQIRTPITAISLTVQKMRGAGGPAGPGEPSMEVGRPAAPMFAEALEKQLSRLTRLEEALLTLSRLDAGTLLLRKEETDVYTLLVLAADNLQELFSGTGTSVEIPEQGEMLIAADPDWTMEAVMNLMKNCMEHNEGGCVRCSYAQNPLYTEIVIRDEGEGFAGEDLPHLFERFYRGKNAREGGIGIGLALAKEIIERQNGTLRALNRPEGGASFEIRIYRH